jgi:ketosteroid isomerase-like protein
MFRQFPMLLILAGCASQSSLSVGERARAQVEATERAFAKSMADRDFAAFQNFLSSEAIFFTAAEPLRGKEQVAQWWSRFYKDPAAPFSWAPDRVEVLDSGTLALSTGPVRDPSGQVTGRFASIWRQEKPGVWRIVFDRGESLARQPAAP